MRKRYLLFFFLLSGCASSMPEDKYREFSEFSIRMQKCFAQGYMKMELYAEASNALNYAVNTWSYDKAKMSAMTSRARSTTHVNKDTCPMVNAQAYQMISLVRQERVDRSEARESWNNAIRDINSNRPVYCNRIGTMTMCQ